MKHHLDELLLIVGLFAIIGLVAWAITNLADNKTRATRRIPHVHIGEIQIVPTEGK